MGALSKDALVFGMGFLSGPHAKLSFGGEGAKMKITDRARSALNELLQAGYCKPATPTDQIKNREHYVGTANMFLLAKNAGLDPFDTALGSWPSFERITP